MENKLKILGFAGSLRDGSLNKKLLHAAQELSPQDAELEIFDLKDIPLFNADIEAKGDPQSVKDFKIKISEADAVLIATPEYNHSIPGVLKNALDWASRSPEKVLNKKPVAMIGTSDGITGATRSQQHLIQVLATINAYTLYKPEVIVPNGDKKFDEQGNLIDDKTKAKIATLLTELIKWTKLVSRS